MFEPKQITIMLGTYIVGDGLGTMLTRIMPGIWPGSFYLETLNFRTTGDIRLKPHWCGETGLLLACLYEALSFVFS